MTLSHQIRVVALGYQIQTTKFSRTVFTKVALYNIPVITRGYSPIVLNQFIIKHAIALCKRIGKYGNRTA